MKNFAAKVEEGKEGTDGKLSVGPVFGSLPAKDDFPPLDHDMTTSWDIFRLAVPTVWFVCLSMTPLPRGFEFIKGVILESNPFDMERDLVTATPKKKRNKLLNHYKVEIDGQYKNLAAEKK